MKLLKLLLSDWSVDLASTRLSIDLVRCSLFEAVRSGSGLNNGRHNWRGESIDGTGK